MTLPKLKLAPAAASYVFTMPTGLLQAELDGGPPRTRLDMTGGWIMVSCQWEGDSSVLKYLQQTYRYYEANGGAHFLVDMVIDEGELIEREATYVKGSAHLVSVQGLLYTWGANLLVAPIQGADIDWPEDIDYQSALISTEDGDLLGT